MVTGRHVKEEVRDCLEETRNLRTPQMYAALALDLNTGLRDQELREIRWERIDLQHKKTLTVGQSKTVAGTGRVIPLNETAAALEALEAHASWYIEWHDNRHTLVTELAESGAGDEVMMSIAGHVSRAMLSRYSHVRMEAKRRTVRTH